MKTQLFLWAGIGLAAPAVAEPIKFSTILRGEVGYGTNPFLRPGSTRGSGFASLSVSPQLSRATAQSTTSLTGNYSRDQYLNSLGNTDSGQVMLARTDQFTEYLSSKLSATYLTSNRAIFYAPTDPIIQDPLSVGQRSRTENLNYSIQWQPSAADQLSYGGNFSHASYGTGRSAVAGVASGYTQYGANGAYFHTIDARTSAGVQVAVSTVHSRSYPDSRSIEPSLTAKRQLNAIWNVEGHVGLIFQRTDGPFGGTSTSIGFGATVCGTYPQTHFCLIVDRQSQPSGYGGLRTISEVSVTLSHTIDEHSRVNFSGSYRKSNAIGSSILRASSISTVDTAQVSGEYDRDVTQRISAGIGGRYESQDIDRSGRANLVAATVHLTAKLGRI